MGVGVYTSLFIVLVVGSVSVPFFMRRVLDSVSANYREQRAGLLQDEDTVTFGNDLQLEPCELFVNDILMAAKHEELIQGFRTPAKFAPSRNFLESWKDIEDSKVFRLIEKMPKGAVLHSHASAIASQEFVFNMTYRENLYVCEVGAEPGDRLALHFFDKPNNDCDWKLLSDLRKHANTEKSLDERINGQLSMSSTRFRDQDGNAAWSRFIDIFKFMSPILKYRPVHEDHFYRGLEQLYEDNVIYLELRATLHPVYELNGTVYRAVDVARIYRDVAARFVRHHPKFIGAKLIYAPRKTADPEEFNEFLTVARELKKVLPDFFVGFDLVGQEDASPPLSIWIDELRNIGRDVSFFFHAGETNWSGMSADENLIDAVLLNTKRIGHGYALVKHPKILELVKNKKIAIEICPISNQVLRLVKDLRNHPASVLFVNDFPIVVSNDDPGLWGVRGLSYDFYEVFMGIMSARADLRSIKQLAINSIKYSSLNDAEKDRALSIWTEQWATFIDKFYSETEHALLNSKIFN